MTNCIVKWWRFFASYILIVCLFSLTSAQSLSDKTLSQRSLTTALHLQEIALSNVSKNDLDNNFDAYRDHQLRRLTVLSGFDQSGDKNFIQEIEVYKNFALQSGDVEDIALAKFFEGLLEHYNPYSSSNDMDSAIVYMEQFLDSNNWMIAHTATALSSVFYGYKRNSATAVSLASQSYTKIPENDNLDNQIANFYGHSVDVYLHGSLKNTELFLTALDRLIDTSSKINYPVDSADLLNNLIYAMRSVDEPETISQIVEILLNVEGVHPSDTPGMAEMRAAQIFIRIGNFQRALKLIEDGFNDTSHPVILGRLRVFEIQVLAATGQTSMAKEKLTALETELSQTPDIAGIDPAEIAKAKALIAMSLGRADETFANMNVYSEGAIRKLLKSNNTDTLNLLANLENDKARQAEREAAQAEMYRLEQEALKHRIDAFQRGLLIVGLLLIAALFTAGFLFYRSRVATKLAKAAEAALAGEKAKTQFLAVISHELRTPLNGIIGIADLLSTTAPTEKLRQQIGIINNSGLDLLKLVEQILDMSRIDANELEVYPDDSDVREVMAGVEELWRPTIEKKSIIFTSHVDAGVPKQLRFDPLRLRQCVNNLISNASKFTKEGRIHMHVTAAPSEKNNTSVLQIIVADTGVGIRKDVQDNLFRPFIQADNSITRQYGGSGLGLAITRSLARMMGGDLTLNSRDGAGSEFILTLEAPHCEDKELLDTMDELFLEIDKNRLDKPGSIIEQDRPFEHTSRAPTKYKDAQADDAIEVIHAQTSADLTEGPIRLTDITIDCDPSQPAPIVPETKPDFDNLASTRILIVEDVISNQDVMKIFLEPEGCDIMCADNGVEALKAMKSQDFDVVLMDIRMPEMDGIEATRLIRNDTSRNSNVPIIALTADATAETNAQCMAAGANIFLTKPIIATELFDSIRFVRRQAFNRQQADQVKTARSA